MLKFSLFSLYISLSLSHSVYLFCIFQNRISIKMFSWNCSLYILFIISILWSKKSSFVFILFLKTPLNSILHTSKCMTCAYLSVCLCLIALTKFEYILRKKHYVLWSFALCHPIMNNLMFWWWLIEWMNEWMGEWINRSMKMCWKFPKRLSKSFFFLYKCVWNFMSVLLLHFVIMPLHVIVSTFCMSGSICFSFILLNCVLYCGTNNGDIHFSFFICHLSILNNLWIPFVAKA